MDVGLVIPMKTSAWGMIGRRGQDMHSDRGGGARLDAPAWGKSLAVDTDRVGLTENCQFPRHQ
jgi:hypothetical protein